MLSLSSCRFAPFKDQILVLPEGHNFKLGRRGTHPYLIHPQASWLWIPLLLQLHWDKAQQKDNKTRPYKIWEVPLAWPKFRMSEDLHHMGKSQCSEVLKSSWGFSELSRWHCLKAISCCSAGWDKHSWYLGEINSRSHLGWKTGRDLETVCIWCKENKEFIFFEH